MSTKEIKNVIDLILDELEVQSKKNDNKENKELSGNVQDIKEKPTKDKNPRSRHILEIKEDQNEKKKIYLSSKKKSKYRRIHLLYKNLGVLQ